MDENIKRKPRVMSARLAARPTATATASAASGSMQSTQAQLETMQALEPGGASGASVKTYIERQLKSVYDDVLNQPIPDRFLDLLNTLDARVGEETQRAAVSAVDLQSEGKE